MRNGGTNDGGGAADAGGSIDASLVEQRHLPQVV